MQGAVPDPNSGILPVKSFVTPFTECVASPHDCCSGLPFRDVVADTEKRRRSMAAEADRRTCNSEIGVGEGVPFAGRTSSMRLRGIVGCQNEQK